MDSLSKMTDTQLLKFLVENGDVSGLRQWGDGRWTYDTEIDSEERRGEGETWRDAIYAAITQEDAA